MLNVNQVRDRKQRLLMPPRPGAWSWLIGPRWERALDPQIHTHPNKPWDIHGYPEESVEPQIVEAFRALPIRPHQLLIDNLYITRDTLTEGQLRSLRGELDHHKAPVGSPWRFRRRVDEHLMVWWEPGGVSPRRLPFIRVKAVLRTDRGSDHVSTVLGSLGRFLARYGPIDDWSVHWLDVALDYPLWLHDVLVVDRTEATARYIRFGDNAFEPTWYYGGEPHPARQKRTRTRKYDRFFKSHQPVMRLEREIHTDGPRGAGPLPLPLVSLPALRNPWTSKLRPMWGIADRRMGLMLRLQQLMRPRVLKGLLFEMEGAGSGSREWRAIRKARSDKSALALIEQPHDAHDRLYPNHAEWFLSQIMEGYVK